MLCKCGESNNLIFKIPEKVWLCSNCVNKIYPQLSAKEKLLKIADKVFICGECTQKDYCEQKRIEYNLNKRTKKCKNLRGENYDI